MDALYRIFDSGGGKRLRSKSEQSDSDYDDAHELESELLFLSL
jgi:hypothetical protein